MKQHHQFAFILVLCFLFISLNSHAQSTNSQIATTFMNGMKSFLIEPDFRPKLKMTTSTLRRKALDSTFKLPAQVHIYSNFMWMKYICHQI
jgi:hypothetical protein